MEDRENIRQLIVEGEEWIEKLKDQLREMGESEDGEARDIAELLHGFLCTYNHTDGCSWDYGGWDRPCSVRESYLDRAESLIEKGYSYASLSTIIQDINET